MMSYSQFSTHFTTTALDSAAYVSFSADPWIHKIINVLILSQATTEWSLTSPQQWSWESSKEPCMSYGISDTFWRLNQSLGALLWSRTSCTDLPSFWSCCSTCRYWYHCWNIFSQLIKWVDANIFTNCMIRCVQESFYIITSAIHSESFTNSKKNHFKYFQGHLARNKFNLLKLDKAVVAVQNLAGVKTYFKNWLGIKITSQTNVFIVQLSFHFLLLN